MSPLHRALVLAAVVGLVGVGASALVWNLFRSPEVHATGIHPLDVAVADVNGDGRPDVLTANRDGRSLSVFLGDGTGSVTDNGSIDMSLGPTSLTLADMNGDGTIDIVATACSEGCGTNSVLILHGLGDGRFTLGSALPIDGVPYNITVADFDGDGRRDIAASDYPGGQIQLLLSAGRHQGFDTRTLPTGAKPIALSVADVDDNGIPDIVTSDHGNAASSVYLSWGGGEFSERIPVATGELPYAIVLASFDGDRLPDLAVAHSTDPGHVSLLQGRGDGTFARLDDFEVPGRLLFIGAADFDGDGAIDIIVTRDQDRYASVFLNTGDGLFDHEPIEVEANNSIYSLAVADMNRDRRPDLITVDYEQNTLSVSLGERVR